MTVALCLPCYRDIRAETAIAIARLAACSAASGIALGFIHRIGVPIAIARNGLVDHALALSASHVMFIDDDMVFPPETLVRMLQHRRPIVSVQTTTRREPIIEYENGTGIMLIEAEVFSMVERPWFEYTWGGASPKEVEDQFFYRKATAAGIEFFCDRTLRIGHIGDKVYYPGDGK